ncbi:DUF4337 domain-containing protein [Novosphingobium sp. FSW06-99]|uniref:DUF4337 domain-containing protein n=1 Tax=Novosphingobium sp. FSW06-99 TaxID=1739113 RepID=UPI00076CE061|nr:DUF4337 domain-containing protein [Novosphingobium sp. FSW06-99]KUR75922.1 hypothetical protein AQZ49_12790 [Novosphingobium sp. FSW06-99]
MELEVSAESKDKSLNRRIAITVVVLSVFVGLCHIKDENTVQAMERSEAHAIDTWNEYQANKTKQHLAENARVQLQVLGAPDKVAGPIAKLDADIAKYQVQTPALADKARADEAEYDRLRFHHDQFNAADAGIATAISLAAVAALMETVALLWVAWGFGAFGIFMGLNGFLGGSFHPGLLSTLLG